MGSTTTFHRNGFTSTFHGNLIKNHETGHQSVSSKHHSNTRQMSSHLRGELTTSKSHLNKHSEDDDGDGGRDEERLAADAIREGESQGEWNCTSQATVGQTKLILRVEWDGAERVDDLSQHQDAWEGRAGEIICQEIFFAVVFSAILKLRKSIFYINLRSVAV